MEQQDIIDVTRRWIATVVIGLHLCPYARRPFLDDKIRYVVSTAGDTATLLDDLSRELRLLATTPREALETTLLIHPQVLNDFLDYNDFLAEAEQLVEQLQLAGIMQVASFHPQYQFADTQPEDVENYTNRSPYPMLHLLREESVSQAVDALEDPLDIPRRNIHTLRQLGHQKIQALLQAIQTGAGPAPPGPVES